MTGKLQKRRTVAGFSGRRPKREVIIEITVELFRQTHDVRKVSIEDIASAAKVSPTTIYNQFGTRDSLVVEAAKSLLQEIGHMAAGIMKSDLPFDQKLMGLITGKIAMASGASDEVMAKMVSQDKNIAPFIEKAYREIALPLWRDILVQGKREGFVQPDVDEAAFMEYLDIIRIGFSAKKDLLQNWTQNLELMEKINRLAFYGFLKKDIDLFGNKEADAQNQAKES